MKTLPKSPDNCENMTDVREGVDSVDSQLVSLLGQRFGYMRAAARIKQDRSAVRDEARKAEVIRNARDAASAAGIPDGFIEDFWDSLVETSIAYEMDEWESRRK